MWNQECYCDSFSCSMLKQDDTKTRWRQSKDDNVLLWRENIQTSQAMTLEIELPPPNNVCLSTVDDSYQKNIFLILAKLNWKTWKKKKNRQQLMDNFFDDEMNSSGLFLSLEFCYEPMVLKVEAVTARMRLPYSPGTGRWHPGVCSAHSSFIINNYHRHSTHSTRW